jgi:hypothetical protein
VVVPHGYILPCASAELRTSPSRGFDPTEPLDQAAASYRISPSTLRHEPKRAKRLSTRISAICPHSEESRTCRPPGVDDDLSRHCYELGNGSCVDAEAKN